MNSKHDGGPAFPRDHAHDGHNGMTLRDYFAAKAMDYFLRTESKDWPEGITGTVISKAAYQMADAMIRARGES